MNRTSLLAITVIGLGFGATTAQAQSGSTLTSGLTVGFYFPTSNRVRDAVGSNILQYGLGGSGTSRPSSGSLTPDVSFISSGANGNKLFVGSFAYGYEYSLGSKSSPIHPYLRPFAGLSYFDFGIDEPGGRESLKRLGFTYGGEVGVVINSRVRLLARYNIFSKEDSFSFNGVTLAISYAFF